MFADEIFYAFFRFGRVLFTKRVVQWRVTGEMAGRRSLCWAQIAQEAHSECFNHTSLFTSICCGELTQISVVEAGIKKVNNDTNPTTVTQTPIFAKGPKVQGCINKDLFVLLNMFKSFVSASGWPQWWPGGIFLWRVGTSSQRAQWRSWPLHIFALTWWMGSRSGSPINLELFFPFGVETLSWKWTKRPRARSICYTMHCV